jgi:hypothetical protein
VTAPLDVGPFLDKAGRRPRYAGRMRRIVVRMGESEIGRLDEIRAQLLPRRPSRAALVRAFTLAGLVAFPRVDAPLPERCEP